MQCPTGFFHALYGHWLEAYIRRRCKAASWIPRLCWEWQRCAGTVNFRQPVWAIRFRFWAWGVRLSEIQRICSRYTSRLLWIPYWPRFEVAGQLWLCTCDWMRWRNISLIQKCAWPWPSAARNFGAHGLEILSHLVYGLVQKQIGWTAAAFRGSCGCGQKSNKSRSKVSR